MTPLLRQARRIANAMGIGRQTADTDESQGTPALQVALPGGELRSDVPYLQLFGFAGRPTTGADVVVMFQHGDRGRGVAIASGDQRTRPKDLQPGDACLYAHGSRAWLMSDGSIALSPANGKVALTGDLAVTGTVTATEVIASGVHLTTHDHTNGNQGKNTGAPIAGS